MGGPGRPARCARAIAFGVLAALSIAPPAAAHKTNLAAVDIAVEGDAVRYGLRVSAHDLAVALGIVTGLTTPVPQRRFDDRRGAIERYVGDRTAVIGDGTVCEIEAVEIDYAGLPDEIGLKARYRCPEPIRDLSLGYALFFDLDAMHRAIGRLVLPTGEQNVLFDRAVTRLDLTVAQPAPAMRWIDRALRIVWLGVEHILIGIDHVLFLVALLIGATGFWALVKVVTAFTLAHSLTLGLAWFGAIALPAQLVEVAIALSIAYVAGENILGRVLSHRWAVAGGFGLVHGLGFYAVLRELDIGGSGVVTTLFAFNLGVEFGQLAIVAVVYAPLAWAMRRSWYGAGAKAGSALIFLIAAWWSVERLGLT